MIEAKVTKNDELFNRVLNLLDTNGFSLEECDQVRRALRRGARLNDPKITWGYVQTHGVEISTDHARTLRKLLENPN